MFSFGAMRPWGCRAAVCSIQICLSRRSSSSVKFGEDSLREAKVVFGHFDPAPSALSRRVSRSLESMAAPA
eukprot:scaffold85080_cov31-Tisochrysis_lutea.AAC.13